MYYLGRKKVVEFPVKGDSLISKIEGAVSILRRNWFLAAVFSVVFSLYGAVSAEAHFFSIIPDTSVHSVAVGRSYTAKLSFTEEFLKAQAGAAHLHLGSDIFSARFLYADGTSEAFPEFKDYDDPGAVIEKGTDSHVSQATLKKEGTVILDARVNDVTYAPSPKMKMHYWGYSKQILNAKADGLSTRVAGGNEVLEIVPMSEVAEFSAGKTVTFKALFKGQPLSGAKVEWADQASKVVIGDEGPTNTTEIATTRADGTFDFTLKNAGYNCFGIMHGVPPAGTDRKADYYASTLIVDVPGASTASENKRNSGCNAGLGGFSLVLGAALLLKRRG